MVGALFLHRPSALGTPGRHGPRRRVSFPVTGDDLHDLRDHVARALDAHAVAGPHVEGPDHPLVVERGAAHRDAGDEHRLQPGDRGQLPRPPHLHVNGDEPRFRLPRRELEGDRPAGIPGPFPQLALVGDPVQLDHRPVEFHAEAIPPLDQRAVVSDDPVGAAHRLPPDRPPPAVPLAARGGLRRHPESEPGECAKHSGLRVGRREPGVLPHQDVVGVERQRPGGRDGWVELAQGAGGGVSRVLEGVLAGALEVLVHPFEISHRQHRFAAHRQPLGLSLSGEPQRQRPDRPQVAGDVLPDLSVPPRRAPHEPAVRIDEFHRQPVVFGFQAVFEVLPTDLPLHPVGELAELRLVVDALEREHRRLVLHFGEPVGHRSADALRGRVGGDEFLVGGFEALQLPEERVVLVVVDLRSVEDVVPVVVMTDRLHEFPVPFGRRSRARHDVSGRAAAFFAFLPPEARFRTKPARRSVIARDHGRSLPSTASPARIIKTPCRMGRKSPMTPSARSRNPDMIRSTRHGRKRRRGPVSLAGASPPGAASGGRR